MNIDVDITNILTNFAVSFDCNAYGSGSYNNQECVDSTTSTPSTGTTSGSSGLATTGQEVVVYSVIGIALLVVATIILISLKHKNKQPTK